MKSLKIKCHKNENALREGFPWSHSYTTVPVMMVACLISHYLPKKKKKVLFPISELSFYTATPQRRGLFINIYYHCFWYYNIVHCTLPDGWSGSTNQYGFQVRDQQGLLGPYCVTKRIPGYKENCLKFQLYFFFFFFSLVRRLFRMENGKT